MFRRALTFAVLANIVHALFSSRLAVQLMASGDIQKILLHSSFYERSEADPSFPNHFCGGPDGSIL